jgi:hypothetical protein
MPDGPTATAGASARGFPRRNAEIIAGIPPEQGAVSPLQHPRHGRDDHVKNTDVFETVKSRMCRYRAG